MHTPSPTPSAAPYLSATGERWGECAVALVPSQGLHSDRRKPPRWGLFLLNQGSAGLWTSYPPPPSPPPPAASWSGDPFLPLPVDAPPPSRQAQLMRAGEAALAIWQPRVGPDLQGGGRWAAMHPGIQGDWDLTCVGWEWIWNRILIDQFNFK